MNRFWLTLLFSLLLSLAATRAEPVLSDQATAALWTVGPGDELYAAFGHSALRITDPVNGFDRIYNFGTFDFSTPNFYLKFIRGDLDYFLTASIAPELLEEYSASGQFVTEQRLNLTRTELDTLFLNMEENLQPENAAYRYDFVRDNCTTRIRDAVEKVVKIKWHHVNDPDTTVREMVQGYVADRRAIQEGINLLFGEATDQKATARESLFLPELMKRGFDNAAINDSGETRPLVARTHRLLVGPSLPHPAFNWILPVSLLLPLLGIVAWLRQWKWFTAIDVLIFCLCGLLGCVLLFLQFGTRHWVLHENIHLLWAWPTHLLIWFFPKKIQRPYWILTALSALASLFLIHITALGLPLFLAIRALHRERPRPASRGTVRSVATPLSVRRRKGTRENPCAHQGQIT